MSKRDKDGKKPRLPRIPVPPPGRFMEDDKYDRKEEKRETEREIEEAREDVEDKVDGQKGPDG